MSDYPKIYGNCAAGCRYRAVPYEEFLNSASIVKQYREGYTYILEKGRTYRLRNEKAASHWGVSVTVSTSWNTGNGTATGMLTLQLPDFDKYAKGVKVCLLDISGVYDTSDSVCSFSAVYEVNGERHTETFADGSFLANSQPTEDIEYSIVATCTTDYETDLKCWLFNEDAEIEFSADSLSAAIPFFDLAELGLPTVYTDGTTSDLTLDTTDICAALDNGVVKFAVDVDGYGMIEVIMSGCVISGLYLCSYTIMDKTLTLMIAENAIQASASASIETYNGEVEVV